MTDLEFNQAVCIANCYTNSKITSEDISIFRGYICSDFGPVTVTVYDVAKLIKWMCWENDGKVNKRILDGIKEVQEKFIIVD